jgi:hypothetical protein
MTTSRLASLRPAGAAGLALVAILALSACTADGPSAISDAASPGATPTPAATSAPTPTPSPSPAPTPRYTNEPDPDLAALIPTEAAGVTVTVAPFDEFALTPGDVAIAYGELGLRFRSLALAYVPQPRTTLYAMRVDGPEVTTEDLEPHLATAGRYVGIAGLDPEPWESAVVGGHVVWTRPEDNATAAGTHIYTWSSGDAVFLLIGVNDEVNRAIVSALPGQAAPTPSPVPSRSPRTSADPDDPTTEPSPSPEG